MTCCQQPFLQTNVSKGFHKCLSCHKKFKEVTSYECPSCHKESQSLTCLNLRDENGNTDWRICDYCLYEYRRPDQITHHRIKWLD